MASIYPINTTAMMSGPSSNGGSVSPRQVATPKNVAFELLFLDSPQCRARLPMRVQIYPHDTTDSIVTTVKNFYGLYSGPTGSKGVSFEDEHGNTLIARYENFRNNMVVYVRVIEEPPIPTSAMDSHHYRAGGPVASDAFYGADGYGMQQQQQQQQRQQQQQQPQPQQQQQQQQQQRMGQDLGRPTSRSSRRRSPSPGTSRGRRSDSSSTTGKKSQPRSIKSRGNATHGNTDAYTDSMNGYSSGDNAPSTASGKAKEQLGTMDISVENIVQGGRRKRAKFESSELPLFAPPQMPAATSNPSVSPARRLEHHHRHSLSYVQPSQNPFTNPRPLQSPQSYSSGHAHSGMYSTPATDRRGRGSISYSSNGMSSGMGILPTPDPTVGSCMSEEDKDVAIQLMRLGEMSNISHGRTSASTLDDTFSGRADVASSLGATSDSDSDSDSEGDVAPPRRQKLEMAGISRSIYHTTEAHFMAPMESTEVSGDDADYEDGVDAQLKAMASKTKHKSSSASGSKVANSSSGSNSNNNNTNTNTNTKTIKAPRPANGSKSKKAPTATNGPMSPASMSCSRKQSIASIGNVAQSGEEEQPDLSTKPRCQRCRKSKKGCDRQRPCGRCRDAGLSADQCISEDEGNGRKGRYGRHMGVPVKKEELAASQQPALLPAAPITTGTIPTDKAKKRKR